MKRKKKYTEKVTKFACNIEVIFYFYGITKEQQKNHQVEYAH